MMLSIEKIVAAIVEGQQDAQVLAELARGCLRRQQQQLECANYPNLCANRA
ncbi:MAG TPA: hypothetical protein V6C91_17645 [Coleofasciculaceae cyanobacterium]